MAAEIARVVRALGENVVGLDATPLVGGLDTATYRLDVRLSDGTARSHVLHHYREWDPVRARDRVNRERRLLEALAPLSRWAPRTLLSDPDGAWLGEPATVLTYLPGAPTPPPQVASGPARDTWIEEFARPLVALHDIPLGRLPSDCRTDDPDGGLEGVAREARDDDLSRALLAALRRTGPPRAAPRALLHHDYWYGNTLWSDGGLSGVIDWISARIGDPQKDVALARCDLAVTLDLRASNEFVDRYRSLGGPWARSPIGICSGRSWDTAGSRSGSEATRSLDCPTFRSRKGARESSRSPKARCGQRRRRDAPRGLRWHVTR